MKQNRMRLIPAAFVLLLALISVLFRAEENTDFGGVREVYAVSDTAEPRGVEGDVDLLRPLRLHPTSSLEEPTIDFKAGDKALALTGWEYTDGRLHSPVYSEYRYGTLERWHGNWYDSERRWVSYDDLGYGASPGVGPSGLPCPVIEAGSEFSIGVKLPLHDPGKYRVTCYFRECLDAENFTTGDTLYSVSYTITVEPEQPSGEDLDLAGVQLIDYSGSGDPDLPAHRVKILLRNHRRSLSSPILWKRDTVKLETLVGGEWVELDVEFGQSVYAQRFAQDTDGDNNALFENRLDEWYPAGITADYNRYGCWVTPYIEIPEPSPSRVYRLTMEFSSQNLSEPGRFRTLTLNLDFN